MQACMKRWLCCQAAAESHAYLQSCREFGILILHLSQLQTASSLLVSESCRSKRHAGFCCCLLTVIYPSPPRLEVEIGLVSGPFNSSSGRLHRARQRCGARGKWFNLVVWDAQKKGIKVWQRTSAQVDKMLNCRAMKIRIVHQIYNNEIIMVTWVCVVDVYWYMPYHLLESWLVKYPAHTPTGQFICKQLSKAGAVLELFWVSPEQCAWFVKRHSNFAWLFPFHEQGSQSFWRRFSLLHNLPTL